MICPCTYILIKYEIYQIFLGELAVFLVLLINRLSKMGLGRHRKIRISFLRQWSTCSAGEKPYISRN